MGFIVLVLLRRDMASQYDKGRYTTTRVSKKDK